MANPAQADEQAATPPSAPEPRSAPARRTSTLAQMRRDENGLTTLEWLLIVAAVAGLAALAVVLVTNVVSDTSEQIAGNSARLTAAQLAGQRVTNQAHDDVPAALTGTPSLADWQNAWSAVENDYEESCERIEIIYSDIDDLMANWVLAAQPTAVAGFTRAAWQNRLDDPDTEGCLVAVP